MERWAPVEHKRRGKKKARKDVAETTAMDDNGDEGEDEVTAGEEEDDTSRKERRVLKFWLPPIEGSAVLTMALAFAWQKAVWLWPKVMVHFVLWFTFGFIMAVGILLLCFSLTPTTIGFGIALIGFSIGTGLYVCWVNHHTDFTARVYHMSLLPTAKFPGLNGPAYLMLAVGFLWMSLWCFAVIGALNFYYSPFTIIALVLSLSWTTEVMQNVTNLTSSSA